MPYSRPARTLEVATHPPTYAARLAASRPQVGEELRARYRVVLLDEYQDTGHAQRIALSALFGGGVDDGAHLEQIADQAKILEAVYTCDQRGRRLGVGSVANCSWRRPGGMIAGNGSGGIAR